MKQRKLLNKKRGRRAARVRAKVFGTKEQPRLAVFRSNRQISAQLIDDTKGHTFANISSREFAGSKGSSKTDAARKAGELIAKKARDLGFSRVVFDRRHYQYHGRVGAFVDGARKGGLKI